MFNSNKKFDNKKKYYRRGDDGSVRLEEEVYRRILSSDDIDEVHSILGEILNNQFLEKEKRKERFKVQEERAAKSRLYFLKKKAEKFRGDIVSNQTPSEVRFKAILKSMGVKYDFQRIFYLDNDYYIVDFYLPDYKVIIEISRGYRGEEIHKMKMVMRERIDKGELRKVFKLTEKCVESVELTTRKVKEIIGIK